MKNINILLYLFFPRTFNVIHCLSILPKLSNSLCGDMLLKNNDRDTNYFTIFFINC